MLVFAAAAALAAQPVPVPQVAPARQARAVVRIISSAPLRFGEIEKSQPQLLRVSTIRAADGATQIAKLVEFE